MNIYGSISSASAYSAITVLNFSDGHTAKQVATLLFVLAILSAVLMVVCTLRRSFGLQVREASTATSIDRNSPRTGESPSRPMPRTPIEPEAAPSPTPSYGSSEISPISTDEGSKPLAGKRICVTGKLPYKRRYVEDFIVAMGGTISRSVTRNTDFLIYDGEYYRRIDESSKHAKACDLNVPILSWESFLEFCGLPKDYNIFESESHDYWADREQKRESAVLKRVYDKEYERMSCLLKEILCGDMFGRVSCEVKKNLIKPVSVVVKCDEIDQDDIEVLRVCRYEVSPSTNPRYNGDFLFFDKKGNECDFKSLTVDSIARLLAAYGR